ITAIDAGTGGSLSILPAAIIREHCFLQIRMICELIALGCLVAHGDIEKATRLKKVWETGKIIDELEKLHPDFFPKAMRQEQDQFGKDHHGLHGKEDTLTKEAFLKMYRECGGYLHKGSLKNLLKHNSPIQINFPEITARAQKLNDFLEVHAIMMFGAEMFFVCVLRNRNDSLKTQVAILEKSALPRPSHAPLSKRR
ncbi:MAG TPA: hypothetical protein VMU82_19895, partial [Acetobacteraceae bacterium]|nr:hypothetical protein [Acetobacteraceae bacterium]